MPVIENVLGRVAKVFARREASIAMGAPAIYVPVGRKADTDFWEQYSRKGITSLVPRQFLEYHKYELSNLSKLNSTDIIRLLVYIEPNVSHAISNYLRVFDSGHYLTAYKPNGSTHKEGERFLNEVVMRINNPHGDGFVPDTSLNKFILEIATHTLIDGALAGEVEFNEMLSVVGIHSIDPATINFQYKNSRMIPYQDQNGIGEVALDFPTIFYVPVDSIAGDPYGTNQILSVIQPVMNKFRLLQDFARALHNLGFDRIDIEVNQQLIIDSCKARGINDPQMTLNEINRVVREATTSMQSLEADDNPVHLDILKLTPLEGKNASKGLDVQAVVNVLLSEIASGLKTYSTILGKRFGGSTEGYTSVESLLFIKLIEGFHSICKRLLDRIFTLILQIEAGIQAYASWEWLEPSLRPTYESAQYYAAFSLMLWEEEMLGAISRQERDSLVRKMLRQKGPPPADAQRMEGFMPSSKSQPQRDVSQEDEKEDKRGNTNRDRKTGGNQSADLTELKENPLVEVVNLLLDQICKRDEKFIFALSKIREDFLLITNDFSERLSRNQTVTSSEITGLRSELNGFVQSMTGEQLGSLLKLVADSQGNNSRTIDRILEAIPKQIHINMSSIPVDLNLSQGPARRSIQVKRDEKGRLIGASMEDSASE